MVVSFACSFVLTRHYLVKRDLAAYPGLVGEALFILRNESLEEVDTSKLLTSALETVKREHQMSHLSTGFDEQFTDQQILQEFGRRRQEILRKEPELKAQVLELIKSQAKI